MGDAVDMMTASEYQGHSTHDPEGQSVRELMLAWVLIVVSQ